MPRGGARPGAGRPKKLKNATTKQRLEIVARSGTTPLEFLLAQMRDDSQPLAVRLDAAKAAVPFVHPKLSNVEMNANVRSYVMGIPEIAETTEQWAKQHAPNALQ